MAGFNVVKLETISPLFNSETNSLSWESKIGADAYDILINMASSEDLKIFDIKQTTKNLDEYKNILNQSGQYSVLGRVVPLLNQQSSLTLLTENNQFISSVSPMYVASEFSSSTIIQKLESVDFVKVSTSQNDILQQNVSISWENVANAEIYEIYLSSKVGELGSKIAQISANVGQTTSYDLDSKLTALVGDYFVSVVSVANGFINSQPSIQTQITRLETTSDLYLNDNLCLVWEQTSQTILGKYDLSSLKIVCFAGEVFPVPHYKYWKSKIPNAAFINLYGPIEISVICTYYIVDREIKDNETIPIGKGCKNSDVFLLKEDNTKANIGEEGEICIRGSSLSFGYINNFEKTNDVFVQNPLNTKYPELIYKTGDIGRLDNDENIIFIGRKDFQIKHMGYRIELGEIEHFASNIDGINHVCVLYDKDNKSIIMVYEAENEISVSNIRNNLLENIPKYALPTVYKYVKELPRNANGKIDRQLLKEIYIQTVKENKSKQSFRGG